MLESWMQFALPHLWQATLCSFPFALLLSFMPGPARLRQFAGWLGLLRFLLPASLLASSFTPLVWAPAGTILKALGVRSLMLPAFVVHGNAPGSGPSLTALLALVWFCGTGFFVAMGLWRLFWGLRMLRHHSRPFPAEDAARLQRLAALLEIPAGRVTGHYVASNLWLGVTGIFRSRIMIPEGLFPTMDEKEVEAVLLHELVHVKRRDNLLRLLQAGVLALFWFHPLVWWMNLRMHQECERSCDEAVLSLTGARHAYASCLFKALRFTLGLSLPGVSGMSRSGLQVRLGAVLNHQNRKDSPVKISLIVSLLVGLLGLTTVFASTTDVQQAAAKTADGPVLAVSELDQHPQPVHQVPPQYPAELRKANVQGEVILSFVVTKEGDLADIKVVRASDPRFISPSIEALNQWKFRPGVKNGQPVNTQLQVPLVFSLAK